MNLNFPLLLPEWILIGSLGLGIALELLRLPPPVIARSSAKSGTTKQSKSSEIASLPQQNWVARNDAAWWIPIACLLTLLPLLYFGLGSDTAFGGTFIYDPLSVFFKVLFLGVVFVIAVMSQKFFRDRTENPAEYFLILWSSLIGLFFLVSANDFLLLFIALETFTLSLYIMAAYLKRDLLSIEAGLKYLILGSLASAFFIYGISLIYVASGSLSFPVIREAFAKDPHNTLFLSGILMILSGVGFKVASVPFQFWVPDVYEGAPTPTVAYLSVGSKAAGFAILLRVLFTVFPAFDSERVLLFSVLAAMTILYGNLAALVQTNIKRLFGYSSIGHAGYLLAGLAVGQELGITAVLYYLVAYGITNLAAFFVINFVGKEVGSDQIEAYRGLAKRSPFLAGCLFVALLSLAGAPPLAGFFGKFLILLAAVKAHLGWLALIGALTVAVSLYYYLMIVRKMYIDPIGRGHPVSAESVPAHWTPAPSDNPQPIAVPLGSKILLFTLTSSIIALGFWQAPLFNLISRITQSL